MTNKRDSHIQVIYDGGTIKDFTEEQYDEAMNFMDMLEDYYGYNFEYMGETFDGIQEYRDNQKYSY